MAKYYLVSPQILFVSPEEPPDWEPLIKFFCITWIYPDRALKSQRQLILRSEPFERLFYLLPLSSYIIRIQLIFKDHVSKKHWLLLNISSPTGGYYWTLKCTTMLMCISFCKIPIVVSIVSFRKDHMNGGTMFLNILKTSPKSRAFWTKGLLTVQWWLSRTKETDLHVIAVVSHKNALYRNRPENYQKLTDICNWNVRNGWNNQPSETTAGLCTKLDETQVRLCS